MDGPFATLQTNRLIILFFSELAHLFHSVFGMIHLKCSMILILINFVKSIMILIQILSIMILDTFSFWSQAQPFFGNKHVHKTVKLFFLFAISNVQAVNYTLKRSHLIH